ncbi:hypothetical protein PAMP_011048 [Pampus punctatissimus]
MCVCFSFLILEGVLCLISISFFFLQDVLSAKGAESGWCLHCADKRRIVSSVCVSVCVCVSSTTTEQDKTGAGREKVGKVCGGNLEIYGGKMTMSVSERKSGSEGKEEESEDESEILEESPCGRWQKRKEQVSQGNVPGVESASLAMDTEEGVEVVWNEVLFSDKKVFKAQEDKIKEMFENLMQVEHPNIVKFHKYWLDMKETQARVIFITEYMSSGSLKQFLKKTKKNHKTMNVKAWKRWCTQILSALSYLHSCDPPIIHGNLTCDTIFIQHNGLIKIGSGLPPAGLYMLLQPALATHTCFQMPVVKGGNIATSRGIFISLLQNMVR